jgi:type VI secretion system secreted protein VgrG
MLQPKIAGKKISEAMVRRVDVYQEIGNHHHCSVDFSRDDLIPSRLDQFLGQPLVIEAVVPNGPTVTIFEGFVSGGTLEHHLHGGTAITLEGSSQSTKLDRNKREAYYLKKSLADVAGDLGSKNGLKVNVNGDGGSPLNYVQRGETDFDFLRRLADDSGCFIHPTADGVEIRKGFNGSGTTLTWNTDLLLFQVRGELQPLMFRGAHYDPKEKKGIRLQKTVQKGKFTGAYDGLVGAVHNASATVLASQQGLEYLNARSATLDAYKKDLEKESQRLSGSTVVVEGESRNPLLVPGESVKIQKTPEGEGDYGIVRVTHHYDAGTGYINHFVGTPWAEYTAPKKPTRVPSLGLVTAIVIENNDPQKLNRLKIQYHWQEEGATAWTRMMTPYTGKDRGLMFLPEVGDEVVVAFENGDPERPIVIGSVWNGKDTAPRDPYRSKDDIDNNEVKRIITKTGNTIEIVDTEGKEVIEIYTPKKDCWIQLNNDKKAISFHSEKDILIEAPNGEVRISCKNLVTSVSQDAYSSIQGKDTTEVQGDHSLKVTGNLRQESVQTVTVKGSMINELASGHFAMVGALIDINPMAPVVDIPPMNMAPQDNPSEWKAGGTLKPGDAAVYDSGTGSISGKLAFDHADKDKKDKKLSWIEIELVDEEGQPVPSEKYLIELSDGTKKEGMLDSEGHARVDGIDPGTCKVSFPNRDAKDWKKA